MRLLILAVVGVALGVVVRVVLGRRSSEDDTMAPLRVVPSSEVESVPASTEEQPSTRPSPMAVADEPRRSTPGLDASAGWEELTATSIGSRPDR